jgi:hypothetical protein
VGAGEVATHAALEVGAGLADARGRGIASRTWRRAVRANAALGAGR